MYFKVPQNAYNFLSCGLGTPSLPQALLDSEGPYAIDLIVSFCAV
jgi:hypothetical protein